MPIVSVTVTGKHCDPGSSDDDDDVDDKRAPIGGRKRSPIAGRKSCVEDDDKLTGAPIAGDCGGAVTSFCILHGGVRDNLGGCGCGASRCCGGGLAGGTGVGASRCCGGGPAGGTADADDGV